MLPIKQIELDKENPRIARVMEMYVNPTYEEIILALGVGETNYESGSNVTFHSLKESIRTNKGIIHPILVNKKADGKYIAIEGNTRLAIYFDFHEKKVAGNWEKIPCIIYDNLDEQTIHSIRLQAHLVGVREWDPYSKAKYLNLLRNSEHLTWSQIVDFCGGKERENRYYVDAYEDMQQYYAPIVTDEAPFDPTRFSGFVELQKPGIKEALMKAGLNLTVFSEWLRDRKIVRLENTRRLPGILSNPVFKKAFLEYGDKKAVTMMDAQAMPANTKDLSLVQMAKVIAEHLRKITLEEIQRLKNNQDSPEMLALLDVQDELKALMDSIGVDK